MRDLDGDAESQVRMLDSMVRALFDEAAQLRKELAQKNEEVEELKDALHLMATMALQEWRCKH